MMMIHLKFFGPFTGDLPETLVLPAHSDLNQLIETLRCRPDFHDRVFLNHSSFLVNKGKALPDRVLNEGDEVLIMAVLGGG